MDPGGDDATQKGGLKGALLKVFCCWRKRGHTPVSVRQRREVQLRVFFRELHPAASSDCNGIVAAAKYVGVISWLLALFGVRMSGARPQGIQFTSNTQRKYF